MLLQAVALHFVLVLMQVKARGTAQAWSWQRACAKLSTFATFSWGIGSCRWCKLVQASRRLSGTYERPFGGKGMRMDVLLRQMLHTNPISVMRLWQKHAALKLT